MDPVSSTYARQRSTSSSLGHGRLSTSPIAHRTSGPNGDLNGHALPPHTHASSHHQQSTSPRPAPSASRMSLAALVNSPPPRSPPRQRTRSPIPPVSISPYPSSTSSYSASRTSYPPVDRYMPSHGPPPSSSTWPSYPPVESPYPREAYPDEYDHRRSRAPSNGYVTPSRPIRAMVPPPSLQGGEDVWEDALRKYQLQREAEAQEIAKLAEAIIHEAYEVQAASQEVRDEINGHPKRLGGLAAEYTTSPAPTDAPSAKGTGPHKKAKKRRTKAVKAAALEDELLGLAEGDNASTVARSSPAPPQSDPFDMEDEDQKPSLGLNTIVQPSGLTRAEVIQKIESNDMQGLTQEDVKAVQDEMWKRQKGVAGGAPFRKDGTMRKKPGPSKGWKLFKDGPIDRRSSSVRGDNDSEAGESSIMGETVNGEAEAEIAALLVDDSTPVTKSKARSKKRKLEEAEAEISYAASEDGFGADVSVDDLALSLLEDGTPGGGKKKTSKFKQPGVGKGNWTRPTKETSQLQRKAEALAVQNALGGDGIDESETPDSNVLGQLAVPNVQDPRGVSENEAKIRLGLVEDLQKIVWAGIVKDIPRVYRVYQACDTVKKQDCMRQAQQCMRNAFTQRTSKPAYKTPAISKKNATSKAKSVIKELMTFWKKNEKDELIAKKKADKEAAERAKAEEEAREAKRQARKLNFLLTQTELYSHFIGKKIKTKEAEGEDGEGGVDHDHAGHDDLGLDADGEPLPDIDYDDDNEENLRKHAARGAQAAVRAAKDRAKQFDNAGQEALDLDGDELNFQNPTLAEDSVTITQPKMLMAQLKEYQLKGLTWLGNLYEQGINGILADEMGLGKTIQSISLLAYLAEHHNMWGPFLVIAPASTLHNWHQELSRFVPRLRVLPYWGTPEERQTLRRPWYKKTNAYTEDTSFHIVVTSYQIAVLDEKYLQSMRWQYMILDEAQAIKSSNSARWKSLLSLNCRNRLLLTGTPIQNSMHELWALLHFIMPSLFDSHEEFSEWFSKDIENAAGGGDSGSLKPEQLRRLHMILKPFMLRRVKKHVQKELGDKIEIDLLVDLSQRQRNIYKALRQRVSISDLIAQANNITDTAGAKNLMNLVMQFRKVCNHPDLFERADVVSPYVFGTFSQSGNLARQDQLYCPDSASNAIEVRLPKILWTDGGKLDLPSEESLAGSDTKVLSSLMSIWQAGWINEQEKDKESQWGFLKVMGASPGEAAKKAKAHPLVSLLDESLDRQHVKEVGEYEADTDFAASVVKPFAPPPTKVPSTRPSDSLPALTDITSQTWNISFLSREESRFAVESAVAPFIKPVISSTSYINTLNRLASDPLVTRAMYGVTPSEKENIGAVQQLGRLAPGVGPTGLLGASPHDQAPLSSMRVPPIKRLIVDSAKLARLDDLLRELKDGGHRVLLYFQMTKMMDLVEEYLIYRQYKYLRLDGSSPIGDRRDMVTSWQTNPDIFVFCLSTRAGGLGINLTAADTVVFYDHDWNPSNDAQAMDRAHRVGQTKQVTVYRLIARGTIEERILQLARAKKDVQDIVVGTKSLTDVAKPSEIVSLFMDDEELAESVAKRKQAEAHGYVAPSITNTRKSAFGDGVGGGDDDEDDFFSLKKRPANGEDEDFGDEQGGGKSGRATPKESAAKKKPTAPTTKRKAPDGDGDKKPKKKRVKIAVGPDGLPL